MRNKFFDLFENRMREDESLFFIAADMGLGIVEKFQENFPDRFLNVGIAEQNMIGIASGLCNIGFRPFCYTISNFLIQRCFEQIRNDICLHNYPVTLVGTSTGFDNGLLGPTHQVIDDIGCLKILPEISIYSPSTIPSVKNAFDDILSNEKPAYIRIGKGSYEPIPDESSMNVLHKDNNQPDTLVISHGTILENCMKASAIEDNFSIYCMNKIKPMDKKDLSEIIQKYKKIVVIEDHITSSGLYNSLCQFFIESQYTDKSLYVLAPPDKYEERVGDSDFFADKYGYSPEKITRFISTL